MQRSPLQHIIHIISWIIIWGVIMVWVAYAAAAIGSTLNGWRTAWVQEDITDNTGTCKRITAWPANYFIPSRTSTEWNAFSGVAVSKGFTITSCGVPVVNWVCGATANTCTAGTPSGFVDSHCGVTKTWNCLGSGGGSNIACTKASNSCVYPTASNVNWAYGAWDTLYASCPAGTHIITGVGTPYYPGYGSCMGDYINIGAAVWPGSSVQWGNGWTVDFFTFGANAWPTYHGVYSYDYYYGNGYVATDAWCGGWTLTLTCEYD